MSVKPRDLAGSLLGLAMIAAAACQAVPIPDEEASSAAPMDPAALERSSPTSSGDGKLPTGAVRGALST